MRIHKKNPLVVFLEAPIKANNSDFLTSASTLLKNLFTENTNKITWVIPKNFEKIDLFSKFSTSWKLTNYNHDNLTSSTLSITWNYLNYVKIIFDYSLQNLYNQIGSLGDNSSSGPNWTTSQHLTAPIWKEISQDNRMKFESFVWNLESLFFSWSIFTLVDDSSLKVFSWTVSSTEALDSSKKTAPHRPSQCFYLTAARESLSGQASLVLTGKVQRFAHTPSTSDHSIRPTFNRSPFTASTFSKTSINNPKNQNLLLKIYSIFLRLTSSTGNSLPPLFIHKTLLTTHVLAANSLRINLAIIKLTAPTHHTRSTYWESLPLVCSLHIPSLSIHTHCTEAVGPSIIRALLRLPWLLSPFGEDTDNNQCPSPPGLGSDTNYVGSSPTSTSKEPVWLLPTNQMALESPLKVKMKHDNRRPYQY